MDKGRILVEQLRLQFQLVRSSIRQGKNKK